MLVDPSGCLAKFPKTRRPLPDAYQRIYVDMYEHSRKGRNPAAAAALKLEQWMQRQASKSAAFPLLELGAGTLNHVPFEPAEGRYDVVEPLPKLYEGSDNISRIGTFYDSVHDVPDGLLYNRIISIAVLEHVLDLPALLARAALRLSDDGQMISGIPTEGGLLWYLAWRFGTGSAFWLKYRMSYATFMRHEHVNQSDEIQRVMEIFFDDVKVARFPFSLKHVSFYTSLTAKRPKKEAARTYLASLRTSQENGHSQSKPG